MKKMMRYISVMVLLLCSIVASARGGVEVKVEIASLTNGTITSRMSGQTCTLTVTPAAGYYIRKSDITVQKTVSPSAPLRRGAEIPVTDNLTLKGDEPAAYSAECQYSFDIPEGYNALVTATFTECTAITPAVTLQGWTYGDAANEAEVTGNTGKATVSYSYAVKGGTSFAAATPTDAGNYTVKVAIPAIGIYTAGEATGDFTITAAPVTITTGTASKTYDGTALTTPEANISGLVNNETANLTTTGSQTNVGESVNTYTIDWGQTKKANYTVTEQLGKLTVTAATMTVTADGYEGVYDGKAHGITLKNVPEGSTVTYATSQNGTYSETAPTFTDVCDATSVYYKVTNSNYNDASGSATVKITAAPVTITTGSASKTYDGTALTTPEANISGLVNNETATVTATGSQTEVGESVNTYTIDWGQTKKTNYTVTEQLGKLTVTKKALTITAKNATKVYGTDDPALEYEVDGLVEGDKLEGALVRAEGVNVGTYDILQGTLKASANYAVTFNKGTFTITAAELTGITIDNVTAVYDGKAHGLDVPTNEGLTFKFGTSEGSYEATTAPTLTDVGTIDIFYIAEKANYSPFTGKATVTVTKKPLTITAKNVTKVYGKDDPALEYTVEGLVEGDKLEGALVRAEGVNVGTYDILQGTLKASANYAVTFNKGTFTITAAELTGINIDNVTAVYDSKAHSLDVPTNEGVTFKFGTSEGSYEATTAPTLTDVGTLDIFYKAEKANFSPVTGKATVTVTPKAVTVSGIEASISTENGVSTVIVDCSEASIVGVVGGQALTISGVTGTIKETATDGTVTVALDYSKATLGGDHAKNYVLAAIGHQPTVTVTTKKETSVDIAEDGTKTETKTESTTAISEDGSVTVTENTSQTVTDGQGKVTVTEANTVTETKTDGSTETTSTVVEKDGNNNVTGKIETTKTDDAKGTTTERTVVKDSDGKVTETREIGSSSRTNTDGSSNETTTVTVKDGNDNVVNTKNVTVEKGADGSVKTTESTYQSNTDGTTQETFEETLKGSDGLEISSQKTELTNNAEGFLEKYSEATSDGISWTVTDEELYGQLGAAPEDDQSYNWTQKDEDFYQQMEKSGVNPDNCICLSTDVQQQIEEQVSVAAGISADDAQQGGDSGDAQQGDDSESISNVDLAIAKDDIGDFSFAVKTTTTTGNGAVPYVEKKKVMTIRKNAFKNTKVMTIVAKKPTKARGFKLNAKKYSVGVYQIGDKKTGVKARKTSLKKVSVSKAPQNRAPGDDDDEMIEIESGVEYEILDEGALVLDIDTSDGAVIIESIRVTEEEENQTGIRTMSDVRGKMSDVWYTLDGRELDKAPVAKGLYFHGGRKIVVR